MVPMDEYGNLVHANVETVLCGTARVQPHAHRRCLPRHRPAGLSVAVFQEVPLEAPLPMDWIHQHVLSRMLS